jgi:hypothetical protein
MLGIMYRDGVLYYSITLAVLFSGVLVSVNFLVPNTRCLVSPKCYVGCHNSSPNTCGIMFLDAITDVLSSWM